MSDVREVAEAHADLESFADDADDIDREFAGPTIAERVRANLVAGQSRPDIADTIGVTLAQLNGIIATEAAKAASDGGTPAERDWLANAVLDEVARRAFAELAVSTSSPAPLLDVLLDVVELRARLDEPRPRRWRARR